jgi:glycosyltransferase involved in cell wall biosynthesis
LLVDDGSSDRSGQICDEYAQKDSRIRVFHKENGGASVARNCGLDNAKGAWVAFVDSDDWIDDAYLEHLLEGDEDVELRVMGIMQQNRRQKWRRQTARKELFLADDLWRFYKLYDCYSIFMGPYVKLFLSSVVAKAKIRFNPSLSFGEDRIFNLQYLSRIKSISVKNYAEYYYRNTASSLCKSVLPDKYVNLIEGYEKVILPLSNDEKVRDAIKNQLQVLYMELCAAHVKHLYIRRNLGTGERRECLSQIFTALNSSGLKWSYCLTAPVETKLLPCILCLNHAPRSVADTIFRFLFWVKQKNV